MEIDWEISPKEQTRLMIKFAKKGKFDRNLRRLFLLIPEYEFIRRYVDIGCNYGWTVPLMYNRCQNIECFEVRSEIFEYLNMNIINKGFSEKVKTHNVGLSDCVKKGFYNNGRKKSNDFHIPDEHIGDCFWSGSTKIVSNKNATPCQLTTLDSFDFKDVDLIKLDIEGHEEKALLGARKTIEYSRPICILEHKQVGAKNIFESFFKPLDYKIFFMSVQDIIFIPNETDAEVKWK